jgi:8-oxo-dGTP diphosphatase
MRKVATTILELGSIPENALTYSVIGARESGLWIFVRHRDRSTWEMPAGHIEADETARQAALRELYEETGTLRCELRAICDYRVDLDGTAEYGRLFLALVPERQSLPGYEISETILSESLPEDLTYPEVQTVLFKLLTEVWDEA